MLKLYFGGWRWLMTLLVIVGAAVMCGLGVWQFNRLNQRLAVNAKIDSQIAAAPVPLALSIPDPAALEYRRFSVRGTFDATQEVLLRNRSYNEETGYHVITPFRISSSDTWVLIDRGWVPLSGAAPERRADYAPPAGEVTIDGVARLSQEGTTGPQDPPFTTERPRLDSWFRVDIPRLQEQTGHNLLPVFLEEQFEQGQGTTLPIRTTTSDTGPGSHLVYVFQWFSFALILVAGYITLVYQNSKRKAPPVRRPPTPVTRNG